MIKVSGWGKNATQVLPVAPILDGGLFGLGPQQLEDERTQASSPPDRGGVVLQTLLQRWMFHLEINKARGTIQYSNLALSCIQLCKFVRFK